MMRFVSLMMKAPIAAFVYSMEMLVKTMQGIQQMADNGIEAMMSGVGHSLNDLSDGRIVVIDDPEASATDGAKQHNAEIDTDNKEARKMRDQDLSGEGKLKLVRYKILFVKRDYEVAFPEKEELVSYDTGGAEWAGLKVAHFMKKLGETKRPERWRDKKYPPREYRAGTDGENIGRIPKEDEKYLKVYFEVLQRWDREEAEYDKEQVEVLREIRNRL